MKNPYIIPAAMICVAILAGFWMLKPPSEPQKVIVVQPPDISIWDAAEKGNIEAVKQHLAEGVDVNAKHGVGQTPLREAARWGHKEIAELLIAKGADVNAKTDGGFAKPNPKEGQLGLRLLRLTPLDDAIRRKQTATADLLRKHGGKTFEELKAEGK
jgi:ankyrin repeat protein